MTEASPFYKSSTPEKNTPETLETVLQIVGAWWGFSGVEIVAELSNDGKDTGGGGSCRPNYPAVGAQIKVAPWADFKRVLFHEFAHIALQPVVETLRNIIQPYISDTTLGIFDEVMKNGLEEFIQKMDRAAALMEGFHGFPDS